MAYYQPRQGLTWKYRKSDGNIKIVSTADVDVNATEDSGVSSATSPLINSTAVIEITINPGTSVNETVRTVNEITVVNIGTNQSLAIVLGIIRSLRPMTIVAMTFKSGVKFGFASNTTSQDSDLDYGN